MAAGFAEAAIEQALREQRGDFEFRRQFAGQQGLGRRGRPAEFHQRSESPERARRVNARSVRRLACRKSGVTLPARKGRSASLPTRFTKGLQPMAITRAFSAGQGRRRSTATAVDADHRHSVLRQDLRAACFSRRPATTDSAMEVAMIAPTTSNETLLGIST